jgi:hypothetical protein
VAQHGAGLGGDLPVLARGDHERPRWRAGRADLVVVGVRGGGVAGLVEADAEESQPSGGPGPDLGGVLANPASEHECVKAVQ